MRDDLNLRPVGTDLRDLLSKIYRTDHQMYTRYRIRSKNKNTEEDPV